MTEEASFRMHFEKVKASKRKREIDDLELPSERKILSYYEEGEAPVKFVGVLPPKYLFSRSITLKLFRQWKNCF